ncbi:MAG TPA: recombinase [Thermoplasmata archaeon]|nr:recombinase [Thermoplasmata archaeon]
MERISTGIDGLDEAIGGFPVGRTIVVTGNAGAGKTILCLQFINACCRNGLRSMYMASEEDPVDLIDQASSFGWDLDRYVKEGILSFTDMATLDDIEVEMAMIITYEARKGNFVGLLEDLPEDTKAIVIDSLGSYTANLSIQEFKDQFGLLIHGLNRRGITALVIIDSATSKEFNDMALFWAHGAIRLQKRDNPYTGRRERAMDVIKMRNTRTPTELLTYEIGENGITILSQSS